MNPMRVGWGSWGEKSINAENKAILQGVKEELGRWGT